MSITHVSSVTHLEGILSKSKDKLSVIDFHATWCGPCHAIAPTFEALAKQYKNVNFLKCDVDQAQDVAKLYSVTAMPTFVFLKGGSKVHQVRGADRAGLESGLRQYSGASGSGSAAFTGKGQTLGGSSAVDPSASFPSIPDPVTSFTNLDPQIKVFLALIGAYVVFWYFS